jgi:hypothetical protein
MLHHISSHDLNRYHLSVLGQLELAVIEEHLLWCRDCLARAEEWLNDLRVKGRSHVDHITTDDLERYHLGQLDGEPTLAGIEAHLSHCRECADRMLALNRFIYLVQIGVIKRPFE